MCAHKHEGGGVTTAKRQTGPSNTDSGLSGGLTDGVVWLQRNALSGLEGRLSYMQCDCGAR